nr:unnamed protein product [Meloidogyne enterolobii]
MRKNWEQCKPNFYRDPQRSIRDPYVCSPCKCDHCGLVAGKCYCKSNVDGPNCDRCKNGFWEMRKEDPDGCRPCACNLIGTYGNEGCDKVTGKCTCKALVMGEQCDHCLQEHYGLSVDDPNGCKPCVCDTGGAYGNHCDSAEGMCRCRSNYSGRKMDISGHSSINIHLN